MNDQSTSLYDQYNSSPETTEVPYDLKDGLMRVDRVKNGIVTGTFFVAKGYKGKIYASRDPHTDLIKLAVDDGNLHPKLQGSFSSLQRAVQAIKQLYGVKDYVQEDDRTGPTDEGDLLEIAEYELQNIHFRVEKFGDRSRRMTTTFQNNARVFFAPYYDSPAWIEIKAGERASAWSSEQSIIDHILSEHQKKLAPEKPVRKQTISSKGK